MDPTDLGSMTDTFVDFAYMGVFVSNESARLCEIRSQKKSKITRWKLQKLR
jgi:hypothetical protein